MRLLVIAKAPAAGRSKTRLCPPCTASEAASLAEAALVDTLEVVADLEGVRPVLVLDGRPGPWLPAGFDVVPQTIGGLDRRLAGAFDSGRGPAVLIGMDTPQVNAALLTEAITRLDAPGARAVLGGADDGGWWLLGLRCPDPRALLGLPMSSSRTGAAQRARLRSLGLEIDELPVLCDVDTIGDARTVARLAPRTRFARRLRELGHDVVAAADAAVAEPTGQLPIGQLPTGVSG
jgi:uncharacterized protein